MFAHRTISRFLRYKSHDVTHINRDRVC